MISSCQVRQHAGWLIDRYGMKLTGKCVLLSLQEVAVTPCTCRWVYTAWAGYAGVQESLEQTASRGTTAPPCCLAPSWRPSLETWGERLSASGGWRSTRVPWEWELCKGSFPEIFQHFRDFAVFTHRGHSCVSLERLHLLFILLQDLHPTLRWILPKGFCECSLRTIGCQCSISCYLWDTVDSEWRSLAFG